MKSKWHLSRRHVLRGAGAAVSLPLLEVMGSSASAENAEPAPKRLAYLYIPNGVAPEAWQPEQVGDDGKLIRLNDWMSDLQPYRDDLIVFRNFWTPRGNGHNAGTATWLTGGGFDGKRLDVGGPSVDQVAADHFRGRTLLPSLEISSRGEGFFSSNLPRNSISWRDARTPVPREVEPRSIFDRMFRGPKSRLSQRSVLDLVSEDAKDLSRRASTSDGRKIEEYLESIREIERRIEFGNRQVSKADRSPDLRRSLARPDSGVPSDHGAYMKSLMDMIVLAFWSDATRVCTFMMDHGQSNRYFNFIDGVRGTWHALSHWKDASGKTEDDDGKTFWDSPQQKRRMYNRVVQWHTEQVAYLIGRLRSIEENGRPLLDHSLIAYGSSLADGHAHAEENLPILLAGGGASIRTGRRVGGRRKTSMSELHLAMLQHVGVRRDRFAESRSSLTLT